MTGLWIAVAAVLVALALGLARRLTDGRVRRIPGVSDTAAPGTPTTPNAPDAHPAPAGVLDGTPWADQAGERATLLQFSSAFCAPCRATRRILADVAAATPGVTHVEVDAEQHLDVVRRLGILRTPTTLVLGPHGEERGRAVGAPRREQVEATVATLGG